MRREATKPTRNGPKFSTAATLRISSLPRCVKPSRFTRSYSDDFVRRRSFEKENEPAGAMSLSMLLPNRQRNFGSAASVQQKSSPGRPGGRLLKKKDCRDFTGSAALTRPAIRLFQREIQWLQREIPLLPQGCLLQSPLQAAEWLALELPPVRLSRSFARTPQGVRHWPECRCIFS
jgi:hypothetical protein